MGNPLIDLPRFPRRGPNTPVYRPPEVLMFYRNCSIYDATPISRCPSVRHFIRQESKMQYVKTSKADQERYTRKLRVLYYAVGR